MIWRFLTAKLHRRLILLMLLATIPAMLAGFWILSQAATDRLRAAAEERLRATTDDVAQKVDVWLGSVARDLALLSRHPDLASLDPARQRALLFELHKVYPTLAYAHTIGPDGMNVARMDDNPLTDYHDRQYFQRVMAGAGLARETIPTARTLPIAFAIWLLPLPAQSGRIVFMLAAYERRAMQTRISASPRPRPGISVVNERELECFSRRGQAEEQLWRTHPFAEWASRNNG